MKLGVRWLLACAGAVVAVGGSGCGGGGGGGGLPADIRGRILLVTSGQPPSPSATVTVAGASSVQTLADGTFIVRNASAGATTITVSAAGVTTLRQALPTLTPNAVNDLGDIFLTDTTYDADVDGTVVRADTLAPVAGARVRISGLSAVTDASGGFAIQDLPAGLGGPDLQVGIVTATGYEDKPLILDIPLGPTAPPDNLVNHLGDILISPPVGGIPGGPTTIRGKVTLQGQTIHTGTSVTLIRAADGQELGSVLTLQDGSYGFWVPVGQYRVRAERAGYQSQTVNANVTRLDVPVVLNIVLVP